MKTVGTLELRGDTWHITTEPHVMVRLKAMFPRIYKFSFGTVRLRNSPETCCDLEWFLQRFPFEVRNPEALSGGSRIYRDTRTQLELIESGQYQPREFVLAHPLRDYQKLAVEMYLHRRGLLLGDVVGLGKSAVAIGSFAVSETLPAVVVCQSHLPGQWEEEIHKFLPAARVHIVKTKKLYELPPADVYIVTYSKLADWNETLGKFAKSMVLDEVQEVRRSESGKHEAAAHLRKQVDFTIGLSATPISNYGGEMWNIYNCIMPDALGSREEFHREWCTALSNNRWTLKDPDTFGHYLRSEFLMLRRTRKDVDRELPAVQTIVQEIEHSDAVLAQIDDMATELAHRVLSAGFHESGEAARELDALMRQQTGIAKAPFVAAFVRMLVESGEQVLLGGWHRAVYEVWEHHLSQPSDVHPSGISICYYTGSESSAEKDQAKADFIAGKAQVMFLSLRSGIGLNGLQDVSKTVVFGELDWSPATHHQFTGRLHRDGQEDHVTEFYLVSNAGSDPVVSKVLGLKSAQSQGVLDPGLLGVVPVTEDGPARVRQLATDYLKRRA